ncbi:MAG: alpha/beta hydrolase [Anaerolineae bacterium]
MSADPIAMSNGQVIGYAEYGDPNGKPLFSFHGTPGSRKLSKVYDEAARSAGLRMIAPERPGYGESSASMSVRLGSYPDQVAEVADKLGIDRFGVIGASGGGMYAAACACRLPDRVWGAGLVSAMMPLYLPDAMRGMATANRVFFSMGRWLPGLAGFLISRLTLASLGSADQHIKNGTSPVADIPPEVFAVVVDDLRTALKPGGAGAALDLSNLWRKLEFRLEDIRVPVFLWHGEADNLAPVTSGRYLAAHIPNCRATFYPGEGHTGPLLNHSSEIMDTLATLAPS